MAQIPFKKDLSQPENTERRLGPDPLVLWQSYKEQATLWRALALLQLPATFLAVITAFVMFLYKDTIVEVPPKPAPGFYSVSEIPDAAFINVANNVANLYYTYKPDIASQQYNILKRFFWEPLLSNFDEGSKRILENISQTRRSQTFVVDETFTNVVRLAGEDRVTVEMRGVGYRFTGSEESTPRKISLKMVMTTVPRNVLNPYGIVVTNFEDDQGEEYDPSRGFK